MILYPFNCLTFKESHNPIVDFKVRFSSCNFSVTAHVYLDSGRPHVTASCDTILESS